MGSFAGREETNLHSSWRERVLRTWTGHRRVGRNRVWAEGVFVHLELCVGLFL